MLRQNWQKETSDDAIESMKIRSNDNYDEDKFAKEASEIDSCQFKFVDETSPVVVKGKKLETGIDCKIRMEGFSAHFIIGKSCMLLFLLLCLYLSIIWSSFQPENKGAWWIIPHQSKLWFAPFFHKELTALAFSEFEKHMRLNQERNNIQSPQTESTLGGICPVIVSSATRSEPYWAWLTATVLRRYGYSSKTNVQFHPKVFIVSRQGASLDQDIPPFTKQYIDNLVENNIIEVVYKDHEGLLPPPELFNQPLIGATSHQTKHFVMQLFDHAAAWNICLERGCEHCLVLEDDAILSRRWSWRLKQALNAVDIEEPNWGILKLFEIDDGFTLTDKLYTEIHPKRVFAYAMFGSFPAFLLFALHNKSSSRIFLACCFFYMCLAMMLVFYITEREFALNCVNNRLKTFPVSFNTTIRNAIVPKRGAVANIYRQRDLNGMISEAQSTVWKTINRKQATSNTMTPERFYAEHSDRIRVDVFVGEYFLKRGANSIKIVEPNLAQHIGFISSEPGFQGIRVAMTSTFEDGRLF